MLSIFDGDKISLGWVLRNTSNFVVDLSSYPTAKYITLRFGLPDTISSGTYETTVMINAGSTALPWEPYCGGIPSPNPSYPQEIKSVVVDKVLARNHENLITEISKGYIAAGVSYAPTDNETYKNAKYTNLFEVNLGDKLYFADNTYAVAYRIRFYDSNLAYLGTSGGSDVDFVPVITKGVKYAAFMDLQGRIGDGFVLSKTPKEEWLENTATLSQPITLHGIGDVMDEIDAERGVYVQRIWRGHPSKTIVFTTRSDSGRVSVFDNKLFGQIFKPATTPALSTFAKWSNYGNGADCTFALSANGIYYKDSTKTLEEINAIFAELGTSVEVAGILRTPIETPLPEVDQIALRSLHSYDGVTHVMCDADIVPTMEAECATSNVAALAMYIKSDYVPRAKYNELESRLSALEKQIVNY
jgi:hypothetical protein